MLIKITFVTIRTHFLRHRQLLIFLFEPVTHKPAFLGGGNHEVLKVTKKC